MIYKEEQGDLFELHPNYWLCQCISSDFGMGKGIAVEFNKRFDQKNRMIALHHSLVNEWDNKINLVGQGGMQAYDEEYRIINIITKRNYWQKPAYKDFISALTQLKMLCIKKEITKLAMPKIGCGLDQLEWNKVKEIIKDIFNDLDIEIVVRYL